MRIYYGIGQALPPEAFISVDELRQSTFAHYLPILVISAPWLHPGHPDPLGFNLTLLAAALKHYTRGANSRWGVAWGLLQRASAG